MPIGIIGSLVICTVLYILFALVLTGIVPYTQLGVAAPVALAIDKTPYLWMNNLVKVGIICGLLLCRDLSYAPWTVARVLCDVERRTSSQRCSPKFIRGLRTPWRSNILFFFFVAPFSAFLPLSLVGCRMTSIGTLFAFVIVCAGVWVMRVKNPDQARPFRTPWVPLVPILGILVNFALMYSLGWSNWVRLIVWLVIGQAIYFGYGRRHSRLRKSAAPAGGDR